MNQQCGHCRTSVVVVQNGSRNLALMRFSQLQRQGLLPSMCESANGAYAVCYDAADPRLKRHAGQVEPAFSEGWPAI